MQTINQSQTIDYLCQPESYGPETGNVDVIETHISVVFLVGHRAFKLKRAVKYPYLDFSTVELRRHYCEVEVAINRRTAPSIYKGVVAVTHSEAKGYSLDGEGEIVDWLVEMARFDENTLFDRLSVAGMLKRHLMVDLAETIAEFHMAAEPHLKAGSHEEIEATITSNTASFSEFGIGVFDREDVEALTVAQLAALRGEIGDRIEMRREAGLVRHCHGDLHLRNICLVGGIPTLFDAIEFNENFAHIDVFYDLAFLLMDLDHRGLRHLANLVLNRYLDVTDDTGGLKCLPLFLSLRAAIRAHVGATAAGQHLETSEAERLGREARAYFDLARDYLSPPRPRLIAVGGLSGSGKSCMGRSLASQIGAAPGARIARSDVLRKRLAGVDQLTRLDVQGYSPEMTARTYQAVYKEAGRALRQGHSVIADAVFARPEERRIIAGIASDLGVPFDGLWLESPVEVMEARVNKRKNNASDADAAVVHMQQSYDLGDMEWTRIDSSGEKTSTLKKGLKSLGIYAPEGA